MDYVKHRAWRRFFASLLGVTIAMWFSSYTFRDSLNWLLPLVGWDVRVPITPTFVHSVGVVFFGMTVMLTLLEKLTSQVRERRVLTDSLTDICLPLLICHTGTMLQLWIDHEQLWFKRFGEDLLVVALSALVGANALVIVNKYIHRHS